MSLEITVTDLGPFKGRHTSILDKSSINTIEAPNAFGKSSFIKGLAACLSLPVKSKLSNDIARRLGILPSSPDGRNPLVNLEAEQCMLEVRGGTYSRSMTIPARGSPKVKPPGDDRFLITGLLLREAEIVRQLDEGSNDFAWLVSTLSLSLPYEEVKEIVEGYQIDARDELERIKEKQRSVSHLLPKIEMLKKQRDSTKSKRGKLESQLTSALEPEPEVLERIEALTRERNDLEERIGDSNAKIRNAENDMSNAERSFRSLKSQVAEAEKAIERIQAKIASIPASKDLQQGEREAREIRKSIIPDLREEYGRLQAELDLLSQAQKWVKGSASIPCPLCERVKAKPIGSIPADNFSVALAEAEDKYRDCQNKLARSIQRAEELETRGLEADKRRSELNEDKKVHTQKLGPAKSLLTRGMRDFDNMSKLLTSLRSDLRDDETKLNKTKKNLEELQKAYGGNEKAKLVKEIRLIESELGGIETRLSGLEKEAANSKSIDIMGRILDIEDALSVYEKWFQTLTELISSINEGILQQRRGASQAFNQHVMRMLDQMDFDKLQVWIDEDTYRLRVQRKTPKGGTDQSISSLSTSERHALSAVLTIAAKEAYAPEIPFFLVDEVLLDFDKKRLSAFTRYLKDTALKGDQVVIVSRLGGDQFRVITQEEA